MGRGDVHLFHPRWTERDPENPGKRRTRISDLWYWRFSVNGKPYSGGPGEKTKAAAKAHGEKRREQIRGGYEDDPRKVRFGELHRILLAEAAVKKPSTQGSMKSVAARLLAYFKDDLVLGIDRARLLEYATWATKVRGSQPSTTNLDLMYLRQAMVLGNEAGKVLRVPRFPKLERTKREEYFRPDEFERMLNELPPWWRTFFTVADEMGWRSRSEIQTRTWADVDFDGGWVVLSAADSKTGKRRVFPMTDYLRQLLETQRAHVQEIELRTGQIIPWVFCRPDGKALGDYRKAWALASKRAGFGKLEGRKGPWSAAKVAHDVRRTALKRWEEASLPRNASMGMSGHDSARTFSDYASATPEALRSAAEKLDEHRRKTGQLEPKVVPISVNSRNKP